MSRLMAPAERWIILSPHLDDGVLSCGGLAAALRPKAPVSIWTIFSAAPFRGPWSPAAMWLHGVSGGTTGSRLASRRRREDREACRLLGADYQHFNFKDAPYWKGRGVEFYYQDTGSRLGIPATTVSSS